MRGLITLSAMAIVLGQHVRVGNEDTSGVQTRSVGPRCSRSRVRFASAEVVVRPRAVVNISRYISDHDIRVQILGEDLVDGVHDLAIWSEASARDTNPVSAALNLDRSQPIAMHLGSPLQSCAIVATSRKLGLVCHGGHYPDRARQADPVRTIVRLKRLCDEIACLPA